MMTRIERVIDEVDHYDLPHLLGCRGVISFALANLLGTSSIAFSQLVRRENPGEERRQGAGSRNKSTMLRQGGSYISQLILQVLSLPRRATLGHATLLTVPCE